MSVIRLLQLVGIAAAIGALAGGVRLLTASDEAAAAIWPVSALIMAATVRWARDSREQALVVAGCTVAVMASNLATGAAPALCVLFPLVNLVEIAGGIWVFRRFGAPLDSIRNFLAFTAVAVFGAPLASGFLATGVVSVLTPGMGMGIFWPWWTATAIGMAVLGPFVLNLRPPRRAAFDTRRRLMFLAAQGLLVVAAYVIFYVIQPPPLFAIYPFLAVAALSHIELGGAVALVLASTVAVIATLDGRGPALIAELAHYHRLQIMQFLIASMVFSVLPISALMRKLERYAAELDQRRAEAEEVSAIKTKLLAYVSHEIRSPLSGVTGLAQLMHDGGLGELTPAQRDILGKIALTGAEVDALASDLIDTAALQSGRARVEIIAVNAAEAARQAVEAVTFRIAQYEARVELAAVDPAIEVAADPLRLRQILVNLLVNGAKYGGRPPKVSLGVIYTGPGRVRFVIADNGPGVAPERRAALFNAFERLGAEKTEVAGSGLGLAVSREIARLQDGAVGLDDGPEGSRFWLELPEWSVETAAA